MADDKSIVIIKAEKGSCVVVWDREDYVSEANQQLKDMNVYTKICFRESV